jgi:hypothetical protein
VRVELEQQSWFERGARRALWEGYWEMRLI